MELSSLPPLIHVIIYLYGFMAACSAFSFLYPGLRKPEGRAVREAINSWWPPALVAGAAVTAGGWAGVALFAGVSCWALSEYLRILPGRPRNRVIEILLYLSVPLHYGMLATDAVPFAAAIAAWIFVVLPLAWLYIAGTRGTLTDLPRIQWGIVLTVVAISHIPRLFLLAPSSGPGGGAGLAGLLLLAVLSNDAAQYVFGKLFGRRLLASAISPKKTWEGLAGGVMTTMAVSAAASPIITPFTTMQGAIIGLVLSILGVLGDLLISGIKRDAGVKDTGSVLKQHGGILDRCDSLLLAAPVYFYGVRAWLR
jgi:phosphatidate cytidylyltransferase